MSQNGEVGNVGRNRLAGCAFSSRRIIEVENKLSYNARLISGVYGFHVSGTYVRVFGKNVQDSSLRGRLFDSCDFLGSISGSLDRNTERK